MRAESHMEEDQRAVVEGMRILEYTTSFSLVPQISHDLNQSLALPRISPSIERKPMGQHIIMKVSNDTEEVFEHVTHGEHHIFVDVPRSLVRLTPVQKILSLFTRRATTWLARSGEMASGKRSKHQGPSTPDDVELHGVWIPIFAAVGR